MEKIKVEGAQIINDEILFPIEMFDSSFIIDSNEILYSSRYKIDKHKVDIGATIEKTYGPDNVSQFQMILDQYRKSDLRFRRFKFNQVYLMQNISFFDAGYRYDFVYFRSEEDGVYAYYYNVLHDLEKISFNYLVNRDELERIFSHTNLDGQYIGNATIGLTYAYNKQDGVLENQPPLLTDDQIVEKYNDRMKFFSSIYHNEHHPKSIDEITNYNITGEMFENQCFLIKVVNGRIIFTTYGLSMLRHNEFKLNMTLYNLMYFRNNLLTQQDSSDIKKLIFENKEGE